MGNFAVAFVKNGQYDKRWINTHMMPEQNVLILNPFLGEIMSISLH